MSSRLPVDASGPRSRLESLTPPGRHVRVMLAVLNLVLHGVCLALAGGVTPEIVGLALVTSALLVASPMLQVLRLGDGLMEVVYFSSILVTLLGLLWAHPAITSAVIPWLLVVIFAATFKLSIVSTFVFGGTAVSLTLLAETYPADIGGLTAAALDVADGSSAWISRGSWVLASATATWLGAVKIRRARGQEVALAQSEARFRRFLDQASVAMLVSRDDRIVYLNDVGLSLVGASHREDVIGMRVQALFTSQDVDASQSTSETISRIEERELQVRAFDDVHRTVEISRMVISWNGAPAMLLTAFDLTDRKWAEEEHRRLQAQIRHGQKLETIGLLAGGIAHDFNNILQAIMANTELLIHDEAVHPPARNRLDKVATAASRGAALVEKMLAYAGRGQSLSTSVNLSALAHEVVDLASAGLSKRVHVTRELQDDIPSVAGDETQLQQVIMNLFTNASDAMADEGGTLVVRSGIMRADPDTLMRAYLGEMRRPGLYAFIEVSDSGRGIPSDEISRIFDPFFTTKERGRGLGLASTMGIINGHHGAMLVTSEPGRGTRFRALFPPEDVPVSRRKAIRSKPNVIDEARTVLIADDEAEILEALSTALRQAGFSVITARDGAEAVALFADDPRAFDAVVLDMAMPRLDGAQALEKIRALAPGVFSVLSTGYAHEHELDDLETLGFSRILRKPYPFKSLVEVLRELP